MTDLAEARWTTIEDLQDHAAQLQAHLQATEQTLAQTAAFLEKERETILKPLYRRLYRLGGRSMRRVVPGGAVERLKRRLNEIYVRHTGRTLQEVEEALERDRFMMPEEAKDWGLIDEILEPRGKVAAAG